jgi:hypothetical protein
MSLMTGIHSATQVARVRHSFGECGDREGHGVERRETDSDLLVARLRYV